MHRRQIYPIVSKRGIKRCDGEYLVAGSHVCLHGSNRRCVAKRPIEQKGSPGAELIGRSRLAGGITGEAEQSSKCMCATARGECNHHATQTSAVCLLSLFLLAGYGFGS